MGYNIKERIYVDVYHHKRFMKQYPQYQKAYYMNLNYPKTTKQSAKLAAYETIRELEPKAFAAQIKRIKKYIKGDNHE